MTCAQCPTVIAPYAGYQAYLGGHLSFAEFDASVRGWIAHAAHADSWGLRRHLLDAFRLKPGDIPGHGRRRSGMHD